jgi:hypothetical protein
MPEAKNTEFQSECLHSQSAIENGSAFAFLSSFPSIQIKSINTLKSYCQTSNIIDMRKLIYHFTVLSIGLFAFVFMNGQTPTTSMAQPTEKYSVVAGSLPSAPHMPVMVETGNLEADIARYGEAKEKWISQYPQEYEAVEKQAASEVYEPTYTGSATAAEETVNIVPPTPVDQPAAVPPPAVIPVRVKK